MLSMTDISSEILQRAVLVFFGLVEFVIVIILLLKFFIFFPARLKAIELPAPESERSPRLPSARNPHPQIQKNPFQL